MKYLIKSENYMSGKMMCYYRTWKDIAWDDSNLNSMRDIPSGVDVVFIFSNAPEPDSFVTALKEDYIPKLKEKGIKLVKSLSIDVLLDTNYENNTSGHSLLANSLYEKYITKWGIDGFDIDMEKEEFTDEELERATGVFKALSALIGPKSGTDKLFVYDTNMPAYYPFLFQKIYDLVNYVLIQSYGRSVEGLQSTFDGYSPYIRPDQYLIGFTFYEEHSSGGWDDVSDPLDQSRAWQYALWQPTQGNKGGVFSYATDRDGVSFGDNNEYKTNYTITKKLIDLMNEK